MLALSVLGPVAVHGDGVELELRGSASARSLRRSLSTRAASCRREVLVERIWERKLARPA